MIAPLPPAPELVALARRVIWFDPPEKSLADPVRLVAYAMTHGDWRDVALLREHLGAEGLVEALERAPPGVFDPRSWAYWNVKLGRVPVPPEPRRVIPTRRAC